MWLVRGWGCVFCGCLLARTVRQPRTKSRFSSTYRHMLTLRTITRGNSAGARTGTRRICQHTAHTPPEDTRDCYCCLRLSKQRHGRGYIADRRVCQISNVKRGEYGRLLLIHNVYSLASCRYTSRVVRTLWVEHADSLLSSGQVLINSD